MTLFHEDTSEGLRRARLSEEDVTACRLEAAREVTNLLAKINKQWGADRNHLDVNVAGLLDKHGLATATVPGGMAQLVAWLDSAHCGTNQSPLYRVLGRLLDVVEKGDHIDRCMESVITHLNLSQAPFRPGCLGIDILCRLMAIGVSEKSLRRYFTVCNGVCTPTVVHTFAQAYPQFTKSVFVEKHFRDVWKNFTRCAFSAAQNEPVLSRELAILRAWLEVSVDAPISRYSDEVGLYDLLSSLLSSKARTRDGLCYAVTLTVMLSLAYPILTVYLFLEQPAFVHSTTVRAPLLAKAVLVPVRKLQVCCTRVIRRRLTKPISSAVRDLPLPPGIQQYIAREFLSVNVTDLASIVDEL